MNTLLDFENILYAVQDVLFEEKTKDEPQCYDKYTHKGDSSQADRKTITAVGLGQMAYTGEGGSFLVDEYEEGPTRTTTWKKFTIGMITPEELLSDMASNRRVKEDKVKLFTQFASDAAAAAAWTKEVITSDFIVSGTSTTPTNTWPGTFRDGLALFANNHVTQRGAITWSNLQTAAPMSALALEEGITMLSNIPSETGRPQGMVGEVILVYGRYNEWRVDEILGSEKQVDTANNNPNVLKSKSIRKVMNGYLPNTFKGWMLLDARNHKLMHFNKMQPTINRDIDPFTGNRITRCAMRYAIDADSSKGALLNAGQ